MPDGKERERKVWVRKKTTSYSICGKTGEPEEWIAAAAVLEVLSLCMDCLSLARERDIRLADE